MASKHLPLRRQVYWLRGILLGVLLSIILCEASTYDANWGVRQHLSHRRLEKHVALEDTSVHLSRRDDYACGPGNPCRNGACCGASGFCGYGPTYCGTGCVSNCNATAECGQYAATPGQLCPLNTCCSQYGFCGTTEDFCKPGCQSNCVLNPSPPAGGSGTGMLNNRVIGYYESWSAQKSCHKVTATDLPLDALTHVNFAFASIDPSTYQVVTMDSSTPSSLFKDATNLKSIKQDLSVFVTIGGWTFSDNGTATQPVFGDIAADENSRQTFANNVVHFMKQYGFDGLDIDWEYPGAPDRGGKAEDTANYALLLKTLRSTFDASGSKFGLTFTAPSSYWYLRWFDLPNMIKYADWINVMTYDLHGVWDASNPIGSIVQGHTNLTEIKLAMELFWRVEIPPSQLALGFGFYGRSFTLADPSCNTPGCPFSGASSPGPCSTTGGMLAYYEIQDVLSQGSSGKKRAAITPTHDKEAAVNYFTFDGDQWVSYDDEVTFKQKVDWADSIGFGGALIWASDLDDDKYSAHTGLLGRSIISTPTLQSMDKALSNPQAVVEDLSTFTGQKCFVYNGSCVNLNDNRAMANACGSDFTVVGWDDAGCGKKSCHCGKPVCCPWASAPKNCQWRGQNTGNPGAKTDCSGQCLPGEINIHGIRSKWGGGFVNDGDTDKCGRGDKVFCCPDPDYAEANNGCSYAACGADCPSGTTSILTKYDNCWAKGQNYCCPDPVELVACHWVSGTSGNDCANAVCNATEVQIDRATYGDKSFACDWGRSKSACCTVQKAPQPPATCSTGLCNLWPGFCPDDDDDESANNWNKRDLDLTPASYDTPSGPEKRGGSSRKPIRAGDLLFYLIFRAYPSIGDLYNVANSYQVLRRALWLRSGLCSGSSVQVEDVGAGKKPQGMTGLQSEHPYDKQIMSAFATAASTGILASGSIAPIAPIPAAFWRDVWTAPNNALGARPPVGSSRGAQPNTPNDRITEALGSTRYPYPFLATDAEINGAKGRVMGLNSATDIDRVAALATTAVNLDTDEAADALLSSIRIWFSVFEYYRFGAVRMRFNIVFNQVDRQMSFVEQDTSTTNLVSWWHLFNDDYMRHVEALAQRRVRMAINSALEPYIRARADGRNLQTYDRVVTALRYFESQIVWMTIPPFYVVPDVDRYSNPPS